MTVRTTAFLACIALVASLTGCFGAATNEEGEIVEEVVQFSADGTPHCPYCGAEVPGYANWDADYDPMAEDAETPFQVVCSSCDQSFRWGSGMVPCWQCEGEKVCPNCGGLGQQLGLTDSNGQTLDCWQCEGTGRCDVCVDATQPYHRYAGPGTSANWMAYPPSGVSSAGDLSSETSPWVQGSVNVWNNNGFIGYGVTAGGNLTFARTTEENGGE